MKNILLCCLLILSVLLYGQDDTLQNRKADFYDVLIRYVEDAADVELPEMEEWDLSEQFSEWQQDARERWSLNDLSYEIAIEILQMTDYQYYQLQVYIETYGFLLSFNELLAVEGFEYQDLVRLKPYVKVSLPLQRSRPFHNFFQRSRHKLLVRYGRVLEPQAGYDSACTGGYLGSPDRVALRYQFSSSDVFSLAFAAEKDAGEQFFKGTQPQGFDHYSFSVALKNIGVLKTAVLGDYRLNLGQGLVAGNSLLGGKGSIAGVRKFSSGLKSVTPLSEGVFFRGAAAEFSKSSCSGVLFYSTRAYDGIVDENGMYEGNLSFAGYHRTAAECEKKHVMRDHVLGLDFRWNQRLFRVGTRALFVFFSRAVTSGNALYQLYNFKGHYMLNVSADYQCLFRKLILFGEVALCEAPAWACLQGMHWHVDPRFQLATVFRHFSPKYHALYANGFGATVQNETGLYTVAEMIVAKWFSLLVYHDYCQHPWLKYQVESPSMEMESGVNLSFDIHRKARIKCQYRRKQREVNQFLGADFWNGMKPKITNSVKVGISYQPFPILEMKTEFAWLHNRFPTLKTDRDGWLFYQDVNVTLQKFPLSVKCRLAFFDTPSYEERLYAFESDVLHAFTVNSYYGRGGRIVLMLKYSWRFLDIWIRLAQSYYFFADNVGSGLTQINGKHKTEVRLQCCFSL